MVQDSVINHIMERSWKAWRCGLSKLLECGDMNRRETYDPTVRETKSVATLNQRGKYTCLSEPHRVKSLDMWGVPAGRLREMYKRDEYVRKPD